MSTEKVIKSEHSKVSPSNLKNLDACPHYEQDPVDALKDMHPNTVAGLRVHLLVECFFDPVKEDVLEGQDLELWDGIEADHVERAQYAVDYACDILDTNGEPDLLLTEPRLRTPHPNTYGRCDLLAIWGNRAVIMDWKDGNNYQGDAKDNLQGHAYALGVFTQYPQVDSVEVHFVYTRLEQVTTTVLSRAKHEKPLLEKVVDINRRFDLAHMSGAQLHCRGDVCTYCKWQTKGCPEWSAMVPDVVNVSKLKGRNDLPTTWDLSKLCEMPDEIGKALKVMAYFEKYQKALKDVALSMARDEDLLIPGYKLVESNSGITCSDADGAYLASKRAGLSIQEYLECVRTVTVGKLVKAMAAKTSGMHKTKAAAERYWREQLLSTGVISEGTEYSYLKAGREEGIEL